MRAGNLRHRVTVQEVTQTRSDVGGPEDSWGTFAYRWASIVPLKGRELISAKEILGEVTHKIRLRWVTGLTQKMRILYGTRIFRIEGMANVAELDKTWELICTELDNA